MMQEGL
jgi:hypothetical protein